MADLDSADELATVEEKIAECQQLLGYSFSNRDLLQAALTHASGASSRLHSNERMEFLGDSILDSWFASICMWRIPSIWKGISRRSSRLS